MNSLHAQAPSICPGCGHPWDPASHVYGMTKCCPDCDHEEPSLLVTDLEDRT